MLCPTCHGTGRSSVRDEQRLPFPCATCNGFGHLHCCDGECAQADQLTETTCSEA